MLIGGQSHAAAGTVQDRQPAPSGSAEVLVDGAVLRGLLCGKREARGDFIFGCAGLHDAGCYVFSYRWAVLEAVTRAAAYSQTFVKSGCWSIRKSPLEVLSYWQTRVSTTGAFFRAGKRRATNSRAASTAATLATRDCVSGSTGAPW